MLYGLIKVILDHIGVIQVWSFTHEKYILNTMQSYIGFATHQILIFSSVKVVDPFDSILMIRATIFGKYNNKTSVFLTQYSCSYNVQIMHNNYHETCIF